MKKILAYSSAAAFFFASVSASAWMNFGSSDGPWDYGRYNGPYDRYSYDRYYGYDRRRGGKNWGSGWGTGSKPWGSSWGTGNKPWSGSWGAPWNTDSWSDAPWNWGSSRSYRSRDYRPYPRGPRDPSRGYRPYGPGPGPGPGFYGDPADFTYPQENLEGAPTAPRAAPAESAPESQAPAQ